MENKNIGIKNDLLNKKKLRLDELIKRYKKEPKNEKKRNTIKESDSDLDSNSDSDIENYKNIISGKFNINNSIFNKNSLKELTDKEKIQSNLDEEKIKKTKLKHIKNRKQALGFLPDPINNKIDNSLKRIPFDEGNVSIYDMINFNLF